MKQNNLKKRYELIYETACEQLDNEFSKNICAFENDRCGEKRNTNACVGCCMTYKNKLLGPLAPYNNWKVCDYLKDKKCSIKNIGCKLFTCNYLHNNGIKYSVKDISVLKSFNLIQKIIIKGKVQVPQDEVIKTLLFWRNRNISLFLLILVIIVSIIIFLSFY